MNAAVPVLQTARLILRDRTLEDYPGFAAMLADPHVMRYFGATMSDEQAWMRFTRNAGMWALTGYGLWAVEEKATGRFLGDVGVAEFRRDIVPSLVGKPEFAWMLRREAHGKGYATEAARAALAFADAKFPRATMSCIINVENLPSIRVAEKLGFKEAVRTLYQNSEVIVFERAPG